MLTGRTLPLALLASAGLATASARAQETITLSISWLEVFTQSNTPVPAPDGSLAPGESARIEVMATVATGIGSPATYNPPPGTGTGTIAGLGSVFFDVRGTLRPEGEWTHRTRAAGFVLGGWGIVQQSGGWVDACQAGQFIQTGSIANSSNPIAAIWSGVWTPQDYAPRVTTWAAENTLHGRGSILIKYGEEPGTGHPLYVGKFLQQQFGPPVGIPIIPAPSAALLLTIPLARRRPTRS